LIESRKPANLHRRWQIAAGFALEKDRAHGKLVFNRAMR
jgi:hypothetical protein